MTAIDCIQGSPEWLAVRCGRVTGSRVADVMAKLKRKDGESAARYGYKIEIVVEILTGRAATHFMSDAMLWGVENEPFARAAYELKTDATVDDIGFAIHPDNKRFGASPDGIIGDDGLLECKCPNTSTHLEYIIAGEVPEQYKPQMLAEMACTGRKWVDFVSFDPRLPERLQLFIRRFERDDAMIYAMDLEITQFLSEVDEMLGKLGASAEQFSRDSLLTLP